MSTMTKHDVAVAVSRRLQTSTASAAAAVDAVFEEIARHFEDGGTSLTLRGFGSFRTVERVAFTTRNPRTGGCMAVPASKALTFRQSREIIARLNP